jgi:hypothetical protein
MMAETTRERALRLIRERDIARKQRDHAMVVLERRTKERYEALAKLEDQYGLVEYWHTRYVLEHSRAERSEKLTLGGQ